MTRMIIVKTIIAIPKSEKTMLYIKNKRLSNGRYRKLWNSDDIEE